MVDMKRLILVLTLVTAAAGLVLALVEGATRAPIAEQRRQQMVKALRAVLPPGDNDPGSDTVHLVSGRDRKGQEQQRIFYRGRSRGEVSGVAFQVTAPDGYSGGIDIMVGTDSQGVVTGVAILHHAETPGLGDKITAPAFLGQFRGQGLEGKDWRVKKDGGEFDQLTGATISPRAVVGAVRNGLEFFRAHREEIVTGAAGEAKP